MNGYHEQESGLYGARSAGLLGRMVGGIVDDYTADDAKRDLGRLRELDGGASVDRLATYLGQLESRARVAERVCEAAVEVTTPAAKGEPFQQRQTRFLRALAEWREAQG